MRPLQITASITNRESVSLDQYFSDVNKEKLITVEEEVALTRRIKKGDQEALAKLVKANLRFVISVAKKYQGRGLPLVDLISEGNLGLVKAAQRFDDTKGFKFISYAVWWIRQSIMQSISEHSRVVRLPINQIANIGKMKKAFVELEQDYEREPTVEELSNKLSQPVDHIEASLQNAKFSISIDAPIRKEETDCMADSLVDDDPIDTDKGLMIESQQIEIKQLLKSLSQLERNVLIQFYGIGLKRTISLSTLASQNQLSTERIRQIKHTALSKLRLKMKKGEIEY